MFGALVSGFAIVLLINVVNPEALIARTNLDRLEAGMRFDAYYLTPLSADAAPVLFAALPEISDKRVVPEADLTRTGTRRKPAPTPVERLIQRNKIRRFFTVSGRLSTTCCGQSGKDGG